MKYVGSKNKLAKEIVPIIQSFINGDTKAYIEPFVGGANVIDKIKHKKKIGYDINEYLISLWNELKKGYTPPNFINKEEYLIAKNNMKTMPKHYIGLVGFFATYNAGWFRRYGAVANTKIGKVRNYYQEGVRNVMKQLPDVMDIDFIHSDFLDIDLKEIKNCVIYCDIPYKDSGWEMYEKPFNYEKFYKWAKEISENNTVLISEYSMPNDFKCIWEKPHKTSLDNKNNKKPRIEKLFIVKK